MSKKKASLLTKILAVPDVHFGLHNIKMVNILLAFCRDFKPDIIVILGDLMEVESLGKFSSPYTKFTLEQEFTLTNWFLDELLYRAPNARIIYLSGNHEYRLYNEAAISPQLKGMLSLERNLGLKKRGIGLIPWQNNKFFKHGKVRFHHGFTTNQYAAREMADAAGGCVVFGHTHRIQSFQAKKCTHRHTGFNIGTLSHLNPEFSKTQKPRGHANGFWFSYVQKSYDFSPYQVRLIGKKFIINEREYSL